MDNSHTLTHDGYKYVQPCLVLVGVGHDPRFGGNELSSGDTELEETRDDGGKTEANPRISIACYNLRNGGTAYSLNQRS